MAQKLWDRAGNPSDWASKSLGIEPWQLRAAIHKLKGAYGLGGADQITIWDNGDVTYQDDFIGNIYDEI